MPSIEQIRPEMTWRLRQRVLYPGETLQDMEMAEDFDGIHFGAFEDSKLVGVVSLFQKGKDFQFRKFAIDEAMQYKGIGSALLQYITDFAANDGAEQLWCNARLSAIGFYLRAGFLQTGNLFAKNGFEYEIMTKVLQ